MCLPVFRDAWLLVLQIMMQFVNCTVFNGTLTAPATMTLLSLVPLVCHKWLQPAFIFYQMFVPA